tara:strand:- start:1028 stop:2857 length:1830 start_codon:yes stop_codon:yes gene_type:complete
MCGIAGLIDFKNEENINENNLRLMMKKIKHRGPDDEGIYKDKNIALGHVRLSILDLSKAGHQPMFCNDKRYVITFNGEIYNYIELKQELKNIGYVFYSMTDTEVILAAYKEWGKDCLKKFNGDWAFVIYDTKKKEVFGARDRFGIKPFYYYKKNSNIIFASELKAIIPLIKNKSVNEKLIYEYLFYNRTDHSNETFFKDVYKLKHGHYFTISENNFCEHKWYELRKNLSNDNNINFKDYRKVLQDAVKIRLRSDVPVGVSLSGGIDSSAITSIVFHDFGKKNLHTFSAIYEKGTWADESDFINSYKNNLKNMHFTSPNAQTFFNDFKNFIIAQGEPISSIGPYAQFKVMQIAKKEVTVTLDGQGADEQLAGYHYFFGSYYKELISNFNLVTLIKEVFIYIYKHKSIESIKFLIYYLLPSFLKRKVGENLNSYINNSFAEKWNKQSTLEKDLFNPKSLNESLIDHFEYKLEHLLKWDDLNSMNFSVESRVPFLDHNVVETTLPLISKLKIYKAETKYILREAVKDILPPKIYSRKDKKGFSTPSDEWFRSDKFQIYINEMLNSKSFAKRGIFDVDKCKTDYIRHINGDINITKYIWQWINLEVWFKKFID